LEDLCFQGGESRKRGKKRGEREGGEIKGKGGGGKGRLLPLKRGPRRGPYIDLIFKTGKIKETFRLATGDTNWEEAPREKGGKRGAER